MCVYMYMYMCVYEGHQPTSVYSIPASAASPLPPAACPAVEMATHLSVVCVPINSIIIRKKQLIGTCFNL